MITFYLGNNADTQEVGSWTRGELGNGEGTYWFDVYRLNEDNYSWEDDYRENGKPWDDECLPYLYKGYEDEVRESTNSTLSIDGGYATYASIDTHVGGVNTKQKTLEANAGWKAAGVSSSYSSNSTKSWIYRPGDTSNDIPQNHLSLSGNYSVQLNGTDTSGSQTQNPLRIVNLVRAAVSICTTSLRTGSIALPSYTDSKILKGITIKGITIIVCQD